MTEAAKEEDLEQVVDMQAEMDAAEEAHTSENDMAAEKIAEQAAEIAQLKDQYLRAMAETENVRTRARRDSEDTAKYATTKFARDMVTVIENLQRAADSITPEARAGSDVVKQVGDGIDMVKQELLGIFERNGITRINPESQKFDHNFHQAVAQVESKDVPAGHVVQVLQAGYVLHDRLLKPAMVTVATAPATDAGA
jgi:molecular chaperone GrpE